MRPDLLRTRLSHQLQVVDSSAESPSSQRTTFTTIKALWSQLLRLGEGADSTIMMSIIADKFPLRTKEKLGEHRVKATTWNITALLAALDSVIHELEVMEDANLLPAYPTYSSAIQQRPRSPHKERTRRTTPTRSNRYQSPSHDRIVSKCPFCFCAKHKAEKCEEVKPRNHRRQIVEERQLSWTCLK